LGSGLGLEVLSCGGPYLWRPLAMTGMNRVISTASVYADEVRSNIDKQSSADEMILRNRTAQIT